MKEGRSWGISSLSASAPPSPLSSFSLLSTPYSLLFFFEPQSGHSDTGIYLTPFRLVSNILPVPYILRDDDATFLNLGGMNLSDELTKQAIVHYTTDSLNSVYLSYDNHYPLIFLLQQPSQPIFPLSELRTAQAHTIYTTLHIPTPPNLEQ